jgi:hypothetical protein
VSAVANLDYNWGGNHHNDSLEFDFGGRHFRGYHSSFGWGWRQCRPMDCLVVTTMTGDPVEDGCTCDRTVPLVCVQVLPDGTWPALVDTFEVCPGDETCG